MVTAASLRTHTSKDLAQMAKKEGVQGWHSMRKDQLVRALVRKAKEREKAKSLRGAGAKKANGSRNGKASAKSPTSARRNGTSTASARRKKKSATNSKDTKPVSTRASRRIQRANAARAKLKSLASVNGTGKDGKVKKDRVVLMVRDSYWLHACWNISRQSIQRVRAALAEHWHSAKPILRLYLVDQDVTSGTTEQPERDIEIHGGVSNWYIDVQDPPQSFRVAVGYLASDGRLFTLARSNVVTPPRPGSSDAIDENWADVADDYERIFALSGGHRDGGNGDLRELFEERLRRPMGSPVMTKYGVGAEASLDRRRDFPFEVDAEMIIYGSTHPEAYVTLGGEPVKLRPDGTFTVRQSMPDRRQVLPVVASSQDGLEQHTVVLAVERNTKVMEPMIREANE